MVGPTLTRIGQPTDNHQPTIQPSANVVMLSGVPSLGPLGKSKQNNSDYLRTPGFVMQEAIELLKQNKSRMVYENLKKKYDEVTRLKRGFQLTILIKNRRCGYSLQHTFLLKNKKNIDILLEKEPYQELRILCVMTILSHHTEKNCM